VPIYDVGEHDGMAYIAMKLLSGETLYDNLQRDGTLTPAKLCQILGPVADALDYAHNHGVIHRDIKPGNIFLSQSASGAPQVILTDFGIAKRLDAPGLTTTGALIGTPDYMAPEQIAGRPVDARTDVYALGMLAYRALTGRQAFEGSTQDVLTGHLYRQPPPPSSIAPDLSPALDPVLLRAIATDTSTRWASAGAFVKALGEAAGATAIGRAPALPPPSTGARVAPSAADAINSAPTMVSPVPKAVMAQRDVTAQARAPQPLATQTTIAPAGRAAPAQPRSSAAPWLLVVILALVAGGLAVALGFMLSGRQSSAVAGGSLAPATPSPSPPPRSTAVPTLAPTATPAPTSAAAGAAAPSPSVTATQAPTATLIKPTKKPAPVATAITALSATALPGPSASPTASPSTSPTATTSPTASPSTSPTATDTASPTVDCTDGRLHGGFGQLYRDDVAVRSRLGCPKDIERTGTGSEQFFTDGTMFYWGLNPTGLRDSVIIFYGLNSGTYGIVSADEVATFPEPPPNSDPNAPVRGFGRIYFGKAGVADALGTWISPEIELKGKSMGVIQFFDGGTMIYTPIYQQPGADKQAIFVLYADGAFERYNDPPAG
jgi:serine/threonine-protein kinase